MTGSLRRSSCRSWSPPARARRWNRTSSAAGAKRCTTGGEPAVDELTFVRLRYTMGFSGGGEPPWAHDYPTADTHVMKILNELTLARPRMDGSNVLSLADPGALQVSDRLCRSRASGRWTRTRSTACGRSKGGFIMFDDFRGRDWDNLQDQMRLVFPVGQWVELDGSHPIFHSFFEINDPHTMTPPWRHAPVFYAMFENNDRNGQVMAMANVNNDLGSAGSFPTPATRRSICRTRRKFGVNYFITR